ncbi:hypothetical protein ACFOUV_15865 [Oceanobacillus longus]|uniref:Uncharacterized protein n=1 Tax=Oceanobacillus longus TaxID=930120 RepID=A0ABV8H2M4_9BACI
MLFKKKAEEDRYCIAIFTEEELDENEYEHLVDRLEESENVGVTTEIQLTSESIVPLEKKFPTTEIKAPSFAVLKIDSDRINEETKKMEKKFIWKKLFNTIPPDEYLVVEHHAMYDFTNTLLYTADLEEVIGFLAGQRNREVGQTP